MCSDLSLVGDLKKFLHIHLYGFGLITVTHMNDVMGGGVAVIFGIFLFVLAVLWFVLPFAVFGIKDKLAEIIAEQKTTNETLAALASELALSRTRQGPDS